jgi:Ca2+/Na+ antiporter
MSPAILINLLFPIVIGVILWIMSPAEGSLVSYNWLLWFLIGAAIQVIAAFVLIGRNQTRWVVGWTLLWIASAFYMGSYAPAHIQDGDIEGKWTELKAMQPRFPEGMEVSEAERAELVVRQAKWEESKNAADQWFRDQYTQLPSGEEYEELAQRDLALAAYLLYFLAFAFLSAFFSISWFAGRGRLHEYSVSGGNEEDPLAYNHMGREPAEG